MNAINIKTSLDTNGVIEIRVRGPLMGRNTGAFHQVTVAV